VLGKIVLVLGILGMLLGGAVLGVSVLLPLLTDGRTSWDEAMFGIIPGAVVLDWSIFRCGAGSNYCPDQTAEDASRNMTYASRQSCNHIGELLV
jgi:hypothetical protein